MHWIGWSSRYDCWVDKDDIVDSVDEACSSNNSDVSAATFFSELRSEIKRKLLFGPRDATEVKIRVRATQEHFEQFRKVARSKEGRKYHINVKDLSPLLGKNWNLRIVNRERDFCYVLENSLYVTFAKGRALKEFELSGSEELVPVSHPTGHVMTIRFIRMEGTAKKLSLIMNN